MLESAKALATDFETLPAKVLGTGWKESEMVLAIGLLRGVPVTDQMQEFATAFVTVPPTDRK